MSRFLAAILFRHQEPHEMPWVPNNWRRRKDTILLPSFPIMSVQGFPVLISTLLHDGAFDDGILTFRCSFFP